MTEETFQTNKLRLTKASVERLIAQRTAEGPRRYWDTELPGFYLQFTPAGVASDVTPISHPAIPRVLG